jgi:Transposase DDE domain
MFPGWSRKLFGRAPLKKGSLVRRKSEELGALCVRQAMDLFGGVLGIQLLENVPGFRNRTFPLPVIFWSFLCQVLSSGSCRSGLTSVQALQSRHGKALCSSNTAGFCKARVRIPMRLLLKIHQRLVSQMCPRRGPRTFIIDGTTLSMSDTLANQIAWPQSRSQKEGCGFPIMRVVGLFDLLTGVWVGAATGNYRSSERNLCRKLWKHLRSGDTIIADSGFCCWFTLYIFKQRGVNVVMRKTGGRKSDARAKKLGKGDVIERWKKPPTGPKWLSQSSYEEMPDSMLVRIVTVVVDPGAGHRTTELHLASTVLDPKQMSTAQMGAIYLSRWKVELFIDDLKTTLGMAILTTRSPAMIRRELIMHLIAYNLVRVLIQQGEVSDDSRASFKGALDRINEWLPVLLAATSASTRKRLVDDLLELVAEDQVPHRPYRREPRAVKRRPKPYQLLNRPRRQMTEIPHRSRYKKPNTEFAKKCP